MNFSTLEILITENRNIFWMPVLSVTRQVASRKEDVEALDNHENCDDGDVMMRIRKLTLRMMKTVTAG